MEEKTGTGGGKAQSKIQSATAFLLAAFVAALGAAFLLTEKKEFSEGENRYLQEFPRFSLEAFKKGSYMEELQDYLTDHFPLRDAFMGFKTETEIALGKRKINGVYIADDGYLIEEYAAPENTERIIGQLERFAKGIERADVSLMLIPTAVTVYRDKLPALAPESLQMKTRREITARAGISAIDCYDVLEREKEAFQLFYRTDHHWTSYGAYFAYTAYCDAKGMTPTPMEEFMITEAAPDFRGTVYSKLNDSRMESDTITIFDNPQNALKVFYQDTGKTADSLYQFEYLSKKDKYSLFLDNIHSYIEIMNENADSDRELALIKDSYANCMVPFLVSHYRKIHVFDTRYYRGGPGAFINENERITDVLILYNMNTLDMDSGIGGIY